MTVMFLILMLFRAATTSGVPVVRVPDDRMRDGQEEFVVELRQRGFHELAEQYCRSQQQLTSNQDQQTYWEILATDCDQDHAWQLDRSQRIEKISQTATQLTEFLRTHTPSPEYDLWLRLRQIELLNSAARMEWSVLSVHQQSLRDKSNVPAASTKIPASERFALDASQQGRELGQAMLQQLDLHRRDLDADVLRSVRLRVRFAIAELILSESGLVSGKQREALLQSVSEQAEQLLKSAGQNDRFRARQLMAQVKLEQRDFSAFELRLRSLQGEARANDEHTTVLALRMQAHLLQRQPSQAIELTVPEESTPWRDAPVIQVLKLESLLQLCEVLLELQDDNPQRQQLLLSTASEFRQLHERLQSQIQGVWRQRIQSCQQRFELVLKVGSSGATALEEISLLINSGDLKNARQSLLALADRSSSDSSLTAFALLQSGDLAARTADWSAAIIDLNRAIALFQEVQNPEREARADLLRIYCLGQISNTRTDPAPARDDYLLAVNQHLQKFTGQPTCETVLEYRARYYRETDPLQAASDIRTLLNLPPQEQPTAEATNPGNTRTSTDKLQKLCLLADLLLEDQCLQSIRSQPDSRANQQLRESLFQEFARTAKASLQSLPKESASSESHILELLLRCEPLISSVGKLGPPQWQALHADLTAMLLQTPHAAVRETLDATPADTTASASRDPHSFEVIADRAILAAHATRILASVQLFLPETDRISSLEFLAKQTESGQLFLTQLLEGKLNDLDMPVKASLAAILQQLRKPLSAGPDNAATQLIKLKTTLQLATVSGQFGDVEVILQKLLRHSLSTEQLSEAATLVASAQLSAGRTSPLPPALRRDFWNRIYKQSRSGQPAWLEASLQLAQLAFEADNPAEAGRIIALVDALYPDWGDTERRTRANNLQKSLESRP